MPPDQALFPCIISTPMKNFGTLGRTVSDITYRVDVGGIYQKGSAKEVLAVVNFVRQNGALDHNIKITEVTSRSITLRTLRNRAKETASAEQKV